MSTQLQKRPIVIFAINGLIVAGAERLYLDLFRQDFSEYDIHLLTFFQFPQKKEWYDQVPRDVVVHRFSFKGFKDVTEWFKVLRMFMRVRPQLIVSSLFFSNTVTRVLGSLLHIPIITIEHNTYLEKTPNQQRVDRLLSRVTYKIVAVSKTVLEFTARQEQIPKSKFVLIHNGINLQSVDAAVRASDPVAVRASLGLHKEERMMIAVGRLTAQKNHKALIEGFVLFHQKHPTYVLVIAGEGSLRQTLESLIATLQAEKYIRLLGARSDVPALNSASDFFVSTSHIEGFPLAHTEALCCGVPVVTTKTAGSDELIVDGKNGLFIEASTPEQVAVGLERAFDTIFDDPKTIRASVSRYSIESAAAAYRTLMTEAITH